MARVQKKSAEPVDPEAQLHEDLRRHIKLKESAKRLYGGAGGLMESFVPKLLAKNEVAAELLETGKARVKLSDAETAVLVDNFHKKISFFKSNRVDRYSIELEEHA